VPSISGSADDERLEDPDLSDGGGQGRDRLVVETRAGLLRIRRHGVDRYLHQPRGGLTSLGRARDQRRQASTEPPAFRHHWPPLRNSRHRRFGAFPPSCNVSPISLAGSTGGRLPRGTCTRGSRAASMSISASSPITTTRRSGSRPGETASLGGRTRGSAVDPISSVQSTSPDPPGGASGSSRAGVGGAGSGSPPSSGGANALSAPVSGVGSDSVTGSTCGDADPPRSTPVSVTGSAPVSISDPTSGSGADDISSGSSSADDISSAGFPPGSRVGAWTTTEG